MNSFIYRTLFYVNIYGSYKLSKNSPVFFGPPCIFSSCSAHFHPYILNYYAFLGAEKCAFLSISELIEFNVSINLLNGF